MKYTSILVLLLVLAGCKMNVIELDGDGWVCTMSHHEEVIVPVRIGKITTYTSQDEKVCDQYTRKRY